MNWPAVSCTREHDLLHCVGMHWNLKIYATWLANCIYLGLQKIKKFWSTPSVLLFLDANSKSRRFGRYLQKPVVSFMPSTATLIFFVIPRPPELIIDFAHGKSLVSNGLSQNKSCIPIRMVMCTHTHTHSVQTCNHDHASSKNIIPWELCKKEAEGLKFPFFCILLKTLKNKVT